eukprot:TRINITY_DN5900_c0_g1_i2.p1 TRINITY_DN5900_c0_g1~~TRINITY_DN5900_c0_g1_i2.p1  ORF type:complete len:242 (+),score=39.09 TRINITY_DN5900_c0_g1_i2:46-771(+)
MQNLLSDLEDSGYVILPNALTEEEAFLTRRRLSLYLQEAIERNNESCFALINTRKHRHDLRLDLSEENKRVVSLVLSNYNSLYQSLFTQESQLVEFGVITSHPGAEQQAIHSDVEFDSEARRIYTTFVALQDITPEMGGTLIWTGTHTPYFCEFYKPFMLGPVDPYYTINEPAQMTLKAGQAVLMDTRIMHCGGANTSSIDRLLLHFSFETTIESNPPAGFTYNIIPDLKGKICLSQMMEL